MLDSNCVWSFGVDPKMCQWQQRTTYTTNWTAWKAAGLDAHTQLADPQFVDTAKVFPNGYKPHGDFRVQDGSPAIAMGFKNFPMDSFGIMPEQSLSQINAPFANDRQPARIAGAVRYDHGKLFVSFDGDYTIAIISTQGRTVAVLHGRGIRGFTLAQGTKMAHGAYLARIRSARGLVTQRFLVSD
jgi:hypothetical protein